MTATISREQQGSQDRSESFYLAEAGLAEAYAGLAMGKTGNVGTMEHPAAFGHGLFWVEATRIGENRIELKSTGMAGSGRVVLSLVAEQTTISSAALGVFSPGALTISAGATVDAFDSRVGTYAEQAAVGLEATAGARLGTNAALTIQGTERAPTLINGNASSGPGAPLALGTGVTVTGTAGSAGATFSPPPPTPPAVSMLPALNIGLGFPPIRLPAGLYGITALTLADAASILVSGPSDLVVGDLSLAGFSTLEFDTGGGAINLFVKGRLAVGAEATLGSGNFDPTKVTIQVAGPGPVEILSAGPLYGTIYAPESGVTTANGFELFGSIVASELALGAGVKLHFDRALLAEAAGSSALPKFLAWRIVDLGPETVGRSSSPFRSLGVSPEDLNGPSKEHADQELVIEYADASRVQQTYSGPESAFDWSDVTSVISLQRDGQIVLLGTDDGKAAQEPNVDTSGDQALQELFDADPPLSSTEIRDGLLAASPLSSRALAYLGELQAGSSRLSPADLKAVLRANMPFSTTDLTATTQALFANPDPVLPAGDVEALLVLSSPLPADATTAVLTSMLSSTSSGMSSAQMTNVLLENSPLTNALIRLVTSGDTSLSAQDVTQILAAQ